MKIIIKSLVNDIIVETNIPEEAAKLIKGLETESKRERHLRIDREGHQKKALTGKVCVICGQPLTKQQRKVCGNSDCRKKYALEYVYKSRQKNKTCVVCGRTLLKGKHILCGSLECKKKHNTFRMRKKKKAITYDYEQRNKRN